MSWQQAVLEVRCHPGNTARLVTIPVHRRPPRPDFSLLLGHISQSAVESSERWDMRASPGGRCVKSLLLFSSLPITKRL